MVAKKGDLQAHHFAHHFDRHGASCTSAGETALHKFAKQVLDERLEIALPELLISHRDDTEVVVRATRLGFDEAVLETKDGSIVPDVVLVLRDRRLIVEFKVTHPCDDVKIARIRAMNVGAIEIDLSAYRDRALDEWPTTSSTTLPGSGFTIRTSPLPGTVCRRGRANVPRIGKSPSTSTIEIIGTAFRLPRGAAGSARLSCAKMAWML
ncbi:hypothetical protein [Ancylobacter dichloromethanicus]|uniref:hypothetical protein n=1 Tax=Ancylobacter dichloromethanicus TaxID=518825 RepID=UPI003610EC89